MSTVKKTTSVLGLTGFFAALALLGGSVPVGGVMAAANAETTNSVSATADTWSIVVNGTVGSKTISLPATSACTSFTLNNNGTATLAANTADTVTVTNTSTSATAGRPRVRVWSTGTCSGTSTSISPGASTLITNNAYLIPIAPGASTTWSFNRQDLNACTLVAPGCRVTISATVSSTNVPAGTATNG